MIFQSLISLYDRLHLAGNTPPYGFSIEDIGFVVTIDKDGNMVGQPEDLRHKISANKFEFRLSEVPYSNAVNVRSGNASTCPNFMVDKADYIFGMSGSVKKDVHYNSFIECIDSVCGESNDAGVLAAKRFLESWNQQDSINLNDWKEISGMHGKWIALRLQGDSQFIHERLEVKQLWSDLISKQEYTQGISFTDGAVHDIQSQYAQFKFGSGASLVSFNTPAYESYNKSGGQNAPVSVEAEFKSSAALKYLLRSRTQRIRIGDATTLFWTERASQVETFMGQVLNPSIQDESVATQIQKFLEAIRSGILPNELKDDASLKFYILGLSLNKARLVLRFWYVCSVAELIQKLNDHFDALEMEHSEKDITYPGIKHLLRETVFGKTPLDKDKKVSPVLSGSMARSILTGANYPQSLYQGVMGRIRADRRINYLRASILKAVLQRNHNKEVPMSLDTKRREISYLLGRLFAVLEKAQKDAIPGANTTIKDRFFSAASATPASVFPRLIRLSQHHIDKAEYGYISDRRISEIMENIESFPAHMNLQDQGLFAIAYYQQKNAMKREIQEAIAKKKNKIEGEDNNE